MVIYISDRWGKILATAASDLPDNRTIIDDKLTDIVTSGVKTFECTLIATDELYEAAVTGNYLMVNDRPFTITKSTYLTSNNTIELYCEDAGLDFINKVVGTVKATEKTFKQWVEATLGTEEESGWTYNFNTAETTKKTLEYTSEATALERLLDIIANYDVEMYFSYELQGFEWVRRTVNFVTLRGQSGSAHYLYIDKDISEIKREEDILNLSTVWIMYGANAKPLSKLKGYSSAPKNYTTDKHTYQVVGNELRCIDAIDAWRSKLDTDGRIVQAIYTEYNKATDCINYGVRAMDTIVDPVYTYEVALVKVPDNLECGDFVYVLDPQDNILVEARVLEYSISESTGAAEATLGDFAQLESSMADINYSTSTYTISLISSNGLIGKGSLTTTIIATVYHNGEAITQQSDLAEGTLRWYVDGALVTNDSDPTTFPYIESGGFSLQTGTANTGHTYVCRLEE